MNNQLDIINLACISLNLDQFADLNDFRDETNATDKLKSKLIKLVDSKIAVLLETQYWNFAIKTTPLTRVNNSEGYLYPNDCLRLVGVGLLEYDCCCPSAMVPYSHSLGKDSSFNLINDTNTYLRSKNSDRYISALSFNEVNGDFFYHINNGYCCDKEFDTLFYIHNNYETMRMTNNFKQAVAQGLVASVITSVTQDSQGMRKGQELKTERMWITDAIKLEYEAFKYRFRFNAKQIAQTCGNSRFRISPFNNNY